MEPQIQYARTSDGVNIAYWTLGEGGTPLVVMPAAFGHVVLEWQMPAVRAWYERLCDGRMIVRWDPRGAGDGGAAATYVR